MEFKTIQNEDYKGILELNKELLDHYKQKGISAWQITPNDLLNTLNASHSIVAKDQVQTAGYLLTFDLQAKTSYQKPILEYLKKKISQEILEKVSICIGQICVSKEYRKQGIAERMYQEFLLKNKSYDMRLVDIDKDYKASKALHKKIGAIHIRDISKYDYSSIFAFVLNNKVSTHRIISALRV